VDRQFWYQAYFIFGLPLGLVLLVMLASHHLNEASCEAVAVKMGLPHYYSIHTGIKVRATENGSVSGANIWAFSVTDKAVADRISKSMESGSAVRLKYKQWLIHPMQVDTSYNIVDVLPQQ
jgi:hypothetical protein